MALGTKYETTDENVSEEQLAEARRTAEEVGAEADPAANPAEEFYRLLPRLMERIEAPEHTFLVCYAKIWFYNQLVHPAFKSVPIEERAIFLPHCLQNKKACQSDFDDEGYEHCTMCGACTAGKLMEAALEAGYPRERIYLVPGGSVVDRITETVSPKAVMGVACFRELMDFVDRNLESRDIPPMVMILLRKAGCRNTTTCVDDFKHFL